MRAPDGNEPGISRHDFWISGFARAARALE